MLAHFGHPAVICSYVLAVVISVFLVRLPYGAAMALAVAISIGLAVVDYLVHTSIHNWERLRFPAATAVWIVAVALALIAGLVIHGWQLAGMFLAQGLWDNSWHARYQHHPDEGPRAELDHPFVRWGVVMIATAIVLIPDLLLGR